MLTNQYDENYVAEMDSVGCAAGHCLSLRNITCTATLLQLCCRQHNWSPGGVATGGTGMAIRIAGAHGIPVLNLGSMSPRTVCERLDAIRRAASGS